MTNADAARVLAEMALFLEMDGVPFKPRAYEKAARSVESLDRPLTEIYTEGGVAALAKIPAVGRGIAERLEELIRTGRMHDHEAALAKYPVDVWGLTRIEGIGPKMVKLFYDQLGVRNVADLVKAARAGRIRTLPHCGEKTERKILKGVEFLEKTSGRQPIGTVLPLAREIEARLLGLRGVSRAAIAGSIRRGKETIGDLDLLVVADDAARVMDFFTSMGEVVAVHQKGTTRASVRLNIGMDADLRIVPAASWGAALHYFTGSKDHNVALRRIAQGRGLKLNEYGLFRGERALAGATEEEVYAALGLPFIPPEIRENTGEIEAARAGRLPRLLEAGQVVGDLQTHTSWTDGSHSIEEMVEAARRLGRQYIAITDHTRGLAMTGGCDEARLLEQAAIIREIDRRAKGIRVLAGAEVNIDRDGGLDIADEVLAQLDVVGVAVHSHFNQSREEMTRRLIRAMENPHADILFHPTGRLLGKRPACDIDIDALVAAAKRTGTALEIDAFPERLDLRDDYVRKAVEAGVPLVIDSDAHNVSHLRFIDDFGITVARRGWASGSDVLNTLPAEQFLARLGRRRLAPRSRRPARPATSTRAKTTGRHAARR